MKQFFNATIATGFPLRSRHIFSRTRLTVFIGRAHIPGDPCRMSANTMTTGYVNVSRCRGYCFVMPTIWQVAILAGPGSGEMPDRVPDLPIALRRINNRCIIAVSPMPVGLSRHRRNRRTDFRYLPPCPATQIAFCLPATSCSCKTRAGPPSASSAHHPARKRFRASPAFGNPDRHSAD